MTTLRNTINQMLSDESGLSSVEYALLLALIAAGVGLAASQLGDEVQKAFDKAKGCIVDSAACT